MDTIENIIYDRVIKQIHCDLTIGKEDNDEIPFTEEKINKFINKNKSVIKKMIMNIIEEYEEDNKLDELYNPEDDWIREYLYDYIKY
jgi:hypothetical protein